MPTPYCEGEIFSAECGGDEVIIMETALYGRMQLGRCLKYDYGNIGCSEQVLPQLDSWCSGRRQCQVRVSSIVDVVIPGSMVPCPRDLRSYLEASFHCKKG